MSASPDAQAILRLPHAQHPKLASLAQHLAASPKVSLPEARDLLDASARDLRIDALEIEQCGHGNEPVSVPFAPTETQPGDPFKEGVTAHLHRMIRGPQR